MATLHTQIEPKKAAFQEAVEGEEAGIPCRIPSPRQRRVERLFDSYKKFS